MDDLMYFNGLVTLTGELMVLIWSRRKNWKKLCEIDAVSSRKPVLSFLDKPGGISEWHYICRFPSFEFWDFCVEGTLDLFRVVIVQIAIAQKKWTLHERIRDIQDYLCPAIPEVPCQVDIEVAEIRLSTYSTSSTVSFDLIIFTRLLTLTPRSFVIFRHTGPSRK